MSHCLWSAPADTGDPFLNRVLDLINIRIEHEFHDLSKVRENRRGLDPEKLREQLAFVRLSPESLARELRISVPTLHRELKKLNAPPPGDAIRSARIGYGAYLLRHTRMKIKDVALYAGYDRSENFSIRFKAVLGVSPKAYRHLIARRSAGTADQGK